jgi:hypothetical protein
MPQPRVEYSKKAKRLPIEARFLTELAQSRFRECLARLYPPSRQAPQTVVNPLNEEDSSVTNNKRITTYLGADVMEIVLKLENLIRLEL